MMEDVGHWGGFRYPDLQDDIDIERELGEDE